MLMIRPIRPSPPQHPQVPPCFTREPSHRIDETPEINTRIAIEGPVKSDTKHVIRVSNYGPIYMLVPRMTDLRTDTE